MGTVPAAPSWGCLLAVSGPYTERMFTVGAIGGLIGRSRKCAISLLHDCEVSHNHAVIELIAGVLCIRDVGSTFGTYLNDVAVLDVRCDSRSASDAGGAPSADSAAYPKSNGRAPSAAVRRRQQGAPQGRHCHGA